MKLLIASAALALICVAIGCNTSALRSGAGSLSAEGRVPKDEYKLSTDSKRDKAKSLPVTFSHLNHSTKNYSVDGTRPITCVECHHTDQPASEAAKRPPLATAYPADRTATLTAESIKDANTPDVQTCRACHSQDGAKPKLLAEIPQVTYEGDTDPTVLDNMEAFHRNCNTCHDQAAEARKIKTAPTTNECIKCHTGK